MYTGCEFGLKPLILDGSVVKHSLRINSSTGNFFVQDSVDLNPILSNIADQVDSIKFFNIMVKIDSTVGTPAGTTLSGWSFINGDTLFRVTNVPLTTFAEEISILRFPHAGFEFKNNGLAKLRQIIRKYPNSPLPKIQFRMSGSTNPGSLFCTVHIGIYTQIFSKPPNN